MIGTLRRMGVSSRMLYTMGFGSIGMSVASWLMSLKLEDADLARADRWGIFVGQWAPTFFALGVAMRLEERWGEEVPDERIQEAKYHAKEAAHVR